MVSATAATSDAERRLEELRRVRAVLWPDRDDPRVLSELSGVQSQIRAAERVLGARNDSAKSLGAAANA